MDDDGPREMSALGLPADVSCVVPSPGEWEEARKKSDWVCWSCECVNFRKRESCRECGARKEKPEDELEQALRASAEEFERHRANAAQTQREREADERSLERALEQSRIEDAERRRRVEMSRRGDEEALALALELSKQHVTPSNDEDLRRALEMSARDAVLARDEENRLVDAAVRRSILETGRNLPPGLGEAPPGLAKKKKTTRVGGGDEHKEPPPLLTPQAVVLSPHPDVGYEDNDDSQLELALHLSEQVQSLERVLDADEDAETMRFALATSRAESASKRTTRHRP